MNIEVTIPASLTQTLEDLADAKHSVLEGASMGIEAALREHFAYLQKRPRKDGLAHGYFWSGTNGNSVAEQISGHAISGDTATVSIDSAPLAHKMTGGTIAAKDYGHKYLTIPATDEAVKAPRGARSFQTHFEFTEHPSGGMRPALVSGNDRGSGSVLFWLVRSVTHQPMGDALPADRELEEAAYEASLDVIDAILNGAAA